MKAADSRGRESPAPAQSVLAKFKAPMQVSDFDRASGRWISTSMNPTGECRAHDFEAQGRRAGGVRAPGSFSLQRSTPAGPAPLHAAGA